MAASYENSSESHQHLFNGSDSECHDSLGYCYLVSEVGILGEIDNELDEVSEVDYSELNDSEPESD